MMIMNNTNRNKMQMISVMILTMMKIIFKNKIMAIKNNNTRKFMTIINRKNSNSNSNIFRIREKTKN